MADDFIQEGLCESRRETIGTLLSTTDKEIGRIDNEVNSLFDKIDVINETFNGNDTREGVFESIRNLSAAAKEIKVSLSFLSKIRKIFKILKFTCLTIIAIVIMTLGGSAAGFRLPQLFKDKVIHVSRDLVFAPERRILEDERIKEIIGQYIEEKRIEEIIDKYIEEQGIKEIIEKYVEENRD